MVGYIIAGTLVFIFLEYPAAEKRNRELMDSVVRYNLSKQKEIFDLKCRLQNNAEWTTTHSLHLSFSIITTIGFGELAPKTIGGRVTVVFYAIIGLTLNLFLMLSLKQFALALGKKTVKLMSCGGHVSYRKRRIIRVVVVLVFITLLWLLTALATHLISRGKGHVLASLYNTFITVTTIGFGDTIILDQLDSYLPPTLQLLFMTNIILILVAFTSLFEQIKRHNVRRISKRIFRAVKVARVLRSSGGMSAIAAAAARARAAAEREKEEEEGDQRNGASELLKRDYGTQRNGASELLKKEDGRNGASELLKKEDEIQTDTGFVPRSKTLKVSHWDKIKNI
eukprot:sb/3466479/